MYEKQYLIEIIKYLLNSDKAHHPLPLPQEEMSWQRLFSLAERHSLASLLYYVLPQLPDSARPQETLRYRMRNFAMKAVAVDIKQQAEEREILKRFDKEHIYCMPLKGINTKKLYPKREWRTMGDMDILYKTEQFKMAQNLLFEMEYSDYEFGLKHDHYCKHSEITLEMHKMLVDPDTYADRYYDDVWEKAKPIEGYRYAYVMSLEEQYIYTIVHLLDHFRNNGAGIRFLMDIFVFLQQEEMDRTYVSSALKTLGIWEFTCNMERLSKKLFSYDYEKADSKTERILDELENYMILENGTHGVISHGRNLTLIRKGKSGYLRQKLFPGYRHMQIVYPWTKGRPYLLPAAWTARILKNIFQRQKSVKGVITDLKKADEEQGERLQRLMDSCGVPDEQKFRVKNTWKGAVSERREASVREASVREASARDASVKEVSALAASPEDVQPALTLNALRILKAALREIMLERNFLIGKKAHEEELTLIEPIDWDTLKKLFTEQNLFPMFHEIACRFSQYREAPFYEDNVNSVITMVAQQIKKTEVFLELYRAFLEEGLHPIVMKGIVCRQLYGKYAQFRPSGDEDILVRKEEFFQVRSVMERHGFVCTLPHVTMAQLDKLQDVGFHEKGSGFLIEVHTNLMGHTSSMRTQMGHAFEHVFEHTRTVDVQGVLLTTMSHTDHFLFLVLHAFKHFSIRGVGIRQIMDILLYQTNFESEIDWNYVKEELEINRALTYFGDIQYIGDKYFGFTSKAGAVTCDPERMLKDSMEVGVFGKQGASDALASNINVNAVGNNRGRIFILLAAGFPSIRYMRTAAPYLEEKPWLLPIEWGKRWVRFLKKTRKYDGHLMKDSIKKSRERMELLKKYGL